MIIKIKCKNSDNKCCKCNEKAVFTSPNLCKEHFINSIECKVSQTIDKYNLISKDDKLVIAASGGKDSLTLLHIVHKIHKDIIVLAVDEGIRGYREHTLKRLKEFCKERDIQLRIYSYKDEMGKTLDEYLSKNKIMPCTLCGTFRRYLINKYAKKLNGTKLLTGHNLDDEAQAFLMNLFTSQLKLSARQGLKTGIISNEGFIPRIKPLYFCSEREIKAYTFLKGWNLTFDECPHATDSFRGYMRDILNEYSIINKTAKINLVNNFLKILPKLKENIEKNIKSYPILSCKNCGEPCSTETCSACSFQKALV